MRSWVWVMGGSLVWAACLDAPPQTADSCQPIAISDDFEDGDYRSPWLMSFERFGGMLSEQGGSGVIELLDSDGSTYAGFVSNPLDATDRCVQVEIDEMVATDADAPAEFWLSLQPESGFPRLMFLQYQGYLHCGIGTEGSNIDLSNGMPFVATADRFFRMRIADETMHCETSRDAREWLEVATTPADMPLESVSFSIVAGTYESYAEPGKVVIEGVNEAL